MSKKRKNKRFRKQRRQQRRDSRKMNMEPLENRIVLAAPQFISVQANVGDTLTPAEILNVSPRELTVRFDQAINPNPASLAGVQVMQNGVEIDAISREVGLLGNTVVLRFADGLPDDFYTLEITPDLLSRDGDSFDPAATGNSTLPLNFEIDLGTRVSAVVPQPIDPASGQAVDEIHVYFDDNELDPTQVVDPAFYQLILTEDTATNVDDTYFTPMSVTLDATSPTTKVELQFSDALHVLADGKGTFRLRIGTNEASPSAAPIVPISAADDLTDPANAPGDSFLTALSLPSLGSDPVVVSGAVEPLPFELDFPGAFNEPGQRNTLFVPDAEEGIRVIEYNFQDEYFGFTNLITEPQKQRVREAFEIYGSVLGVDVVETEDRGFTMATGAFTIADADLQLVVLDNSENWNDEFNATPTMAQPSYFQTVAALIGRALEFIVPRDNPAGDIRFLEEFSTETIVPTNDAIVRGQYTLSPDSVDVDLYQFVIDGDPSLQGRFSAEVFAERRESPSHLDSVLRLYQETSTGEIELIAQNDDYFSEDAYLDLALSPGTYYIGISSTGNDDYDPRVSGTGFGGTSQGGYDLRLDYRPASVEHLRDITGVELDGDSDGVPGGVFNFWFQAAAPSGTEAGANEVQQFDISGAILGTFTINFNGQDTAPIAYDATASDVQAALEQLAGVEPGDVSVSGAALPDGPLEIEFTGGLAHLDVPEITLDTAGLNGITPTIATITAGFRGSRTIYVDKSDPTPDDGPDVGSASNPFNTVYAALNHDINGLPLQGGLGAFPDGAQSGDIVRIIGNGNTYEIGLAPFSNVPLADGATFDIPNNVTVMIDAGATFRMRRSAIVVGSTGIGIDHGKAALQVLGTPDERAVFTSLDEFARGEWGGILFAGDLDRTEGQARHDDEAIFLNHVGHADIKFGGGIVNIGSIPQEVAPIDIREARPTIRRNNLTTNGVAAIAATPDSFEESNFHGVDSTGEYYRANYERIGPEIHDNLLSDNTINGLLVRVDTPSGDDLEKLTVSGRWDDTDIIHVLTEVLEVDGTPGGLIDRGDGLEPRTDAQLRVDPSIIVKLDGARIETGVGAQLIAEGLDGQTIVFTSINDNRYGASGVFNTSNDPTPDPALPGDWGGIYVGHSGTASIDHALITFGGGTAAVEGRFVGFNALEIHNSQVRVANSTFVENASGIGDEISNREGRGLNDAAIIFVRGAQPIIVGNAIANSIGSLDPGLTPATEENELIAAISINSNSLTRDHQTDYGRSTGLVSPVIVREGNQGPLIRENRLEDNDLNGLKIRGETLNTESVWDDTDIVHVVFDAIHVADFFTLGGLRLESNASESLVVKLGGYSGSAGFDVTGRVGSIVDRIGGSLQIIGQPGRPVVLTSISDNTVGAGGMLDGSFQAETLRSGAGRPVSEVQTPGGLSIDLNYAPDIEGNLILVGALEEAARFWEGQFTDDIELAFDVVSDNLGVDTGASAGPEGFTVPYDDAIARLQFDAAVDETELLSRLPSSTELLVQGPPGAFTVGPGLSLGYPNAKALGYNPVPVPSATKAGKFRDGTINVNTLNEYARTLDGFVSTMIHEMGHALGFISGAGDEAVASSTANLTSLDLFRLAPGAGAADFTGAPRIFDPAIQQVFYDGGLFDPSGIDIPGLTLGDIPLSRGENVSVEMAQASHWREGTALGMNFVFPGIMGPSGGLGLVSENDLRALGLIGWDRVEFGVADQPFAGSWQGIHLDEWSHDRNVDVITEFESSASDAAGSNGIPDRAEFLGELAASEYHSDENLRLGFEILGVINQPADVDIYSFEGFAGTDVWLDIEHTSSSLDTVVELVNANGQTLARSNDSVLADQTGSAFVTPTLLTSATDPIDFYPNDHFSVNPKDAGMRVTLPGAIGTRGTYFVRVRSNNENLDNLSVPGKTQGSYELNVRIRHEDEVPGSVIKFADIRYAENGVHATGLAANSPLHAEFVEITDTVHVGDAGNGNPIFTITPINVGNPYQTQRGEISVSASLEPVFISEDEVTRSSPVPTTAPENLGALVVSGVDFYQFSTSGGFSLDVDYAAGIGNPDTKLAVYRVGVTLGNDDEASNDDEIVYDLIYSGSGSSIQNDLGSELSAGTFSLADPFIGPVYPGSIALDGTDGVQFLPDGPPHRPILYGSDYIVAVMPEGVTPLEAINQYTVYAYTRQDTSGPTEFVERTNVDLTTVDFHSFTLDDVNLFVVTDDASSSALNSVNPFTGVPKNGAQPLNDGSVGYNVGSLAMRPDGSLFSLSLGLDNDTSGNFLDIDWAVAADEASLVPTGVNVENVGDDGITSHVHEIDENDPEAPPMHPESPAPEVGIQFFGMDINDMSGFGVGERLDKLAMEVTSQSDPVYTENIVYAIDAYPQEIDGNSTDPGTAIPDEPTRDDDEESPFYWDAIPGALTNIIELGHFDTSVDGPGGLVRGLAESNGVFYGVTDRGGLYSMTPGPPLSAVSSTTFIADFGNVSFQGLTFGPGGSVGLDSTLIAITGGGDLYAFDLAGDPQAIFGNGDSQLATGLIGVQGLTFSTLQDNLWEVDAAENLLGFAAPNNGVFTGNESVEGFKRDYNFPGGAHGSFDIDMGFANSGDQPMVYFEYQLRTEHDTLNSDGDGYVDNDDVPGATAAPYRDAFRVYATTIDPSMAIGTDWVLAASNIDADGAPNALFDNSRLFAEDVPATFFRQARIPLEELRDQNGAPLTNNNIWLRFEFATEGAFFAAGDVMERPGHGNGNYDRVPFRFGELTDNEFEGDPGTGFLGIEISNVVFANAERGEQFSRAIGSETRDGTLYHEPPRFKVTGPVPFLPLDYQLNIRPAIHEAFVPFGEIDPMTHYSTNDSLGAHHNPTFDDPGVGDSNRFREQGQFIVHSNQITNSAEYGIRIEPSQREKAGAANLVTRNLDGFVRGPVIENNLVARNARGGILFTGDEDGQAAVPYGRVVNNTVVGFAEQQLGTGIEVGPNAAPTLMNNIVAYNSVGISVDTASTSTVLAGQLFHGNGINGPLGQFAIISTPRGSGGGDDGLFRGPAVGNYLLVDGAAAIDSSVNSQEDRPSITSISSSLGIDFASPILAPDRDGLGQLRVDDPNVESPPGLGSNVIKDRGAFERADFAGPTAQLLEPADQSSNDLNPNLNDVETELLTRFFEIGLFDLDPSGNDLNGVGVDDVSVVFGAVTLLRDDQELEQDVEYTFSFDGTSDILRLIPTAGVWTPGEYEIRLDNGVIQDRAGNPLTPNRANGDTKFTINVLADPSERPPTGDYGDAPDPYPTVFAEGGAVHLDTSTLFLGSTVTVESDGAPSAGADADVDDGIELVGGNLLIDRTATMTATASAAGFLDGWVDFNLDGDWNDDGERIFTSTALVGGANTLSISVPVDASEGTTYARFRFSSDSSGVAPTGGVSDGEVEDYRYNIMAAGFDFGDAPSTYPTLLADDGARHEVVPGVFLGSAVDAEGDALASADASGDGADDDGVAFNDFAVLGSTVIVTVEASQAGLLDGWIDFDSDQMWSSAEQVFASQSLSAGANELTFTVPADAVAGDTFARFRFSTVGGLLPTGEASDGEVEDYSVSIMDEPPGPSDYGDAPAPYPTLLSEDGARHLLGSGLTLGSLVDEEANGQPTTAADGDGADDDGVTFDSPLGPDRPAFLSVIASGVGSLDAWIDFNQDGEWAINERIFNNQIVGGGLNSLSFNVPVAAAIGPTYARFRLTSTGGVSPTGEAADGEVEDYLVTISEVSSWHNEGFPEDVDDDGVVGPLDAITIINELDDRVISNPDTALLPLTASPPPFLDVNDDGFLSPIDAVLVIGAIPSTSGEPAPASSFPVSTGPDREDGLSSELIRPTTSENIGVGMATRPIAAAAAVVTAANVDYDIFAQVNDADDDSQDGEANLVDSIFAELWETEGSTI